MKRSVEASSSAPSTPTTGGTTISAGQNHPESATVVKPRYAPSM